MRKPNFLFIQADQLAARFLPAYGNDIAKTPNIDRLAAGGVTFQNAYCNYPLCAPSRFSMMSGRLATRVGAFDNGSEFPASQPTFAHYLRLLGYQTCLSGKMHFIGPDQLHGFEERVTTDIYPSDFNWSANWSQHDVALRPDRLLAAAGEVNGVKRSGVYERTIQLDYDDEVCFRAVRKIHDLSASDERRPFALFVSFTHPHDPFAVPRRYWDRYRHDEIDMPSLGAMPRDGLDAHSQRLFDHIGVAEAGLTDEEVRAARHAYYGAISYIDDQVGTLMKALNTAGFVEETIVVLLSDHGEALGERGLWFKRSFYDCVMRIPFIVAAPWLEPGRRDEPVSLVDLMPTAVDLADDERGVAAIKTEYDGISLRSHLEGKAGVASPPVIAELAGDAMTAPGVMVRDGRYKYIHCDTDPPLLFDLEADPHETRNLAGDASVSSIEERLSKFVSKTWDFDSISQEVMTSQRNRRIVDQAHAIGHRPSWDYRAPGIDGEAYFRPCDANPSASNYTSRFEVRLRPDSDEPNLPIG